MLYLQPYERKFQWSPLFHTPEGNEQPGPVKLIGFGMFFVHLTRYSTTTLLILGFVS